MKKTVVTDNRRNNKYHAQKWGGYDSKKEARRAQELRLLQQAEQISDLREQVAYELIPAQYVEEPRYGKRGQPLMPRRRCVERACVYVADFVYNKLPSGELIVEDTKSPATRTPEYIIKRKLMLYVHHIQIREV